MGQSSVGAAEPAQSAVHAQLVQLHQLARAAIAHQLGKGPAARSADYPALQERGTTAVNLQLKGTAYGSHASLRRTRSLADDIIFNALAAASDERFPPLQADDLAALDIQVALQSEADFLEFNTATDLLEQLRPGVDGLHLFACCRNVSLGPEAWASHPTPEDFLAALKVKAGLDADHPLNGMMAARYTVSAFPA